MIFYSEEAYVKANGLAGWRQDERRCPGKDVPADGCARRRLVPGVWSGIVPAVWKLYGFDWIFWSV